MSNKPFLKSLPSTLIFRYICNVEEGIWLHGCHHLSENINYVDFSDLYVDLSVIYVDLSDLNGYLSERNQH